MKELIPVTSVVLNEQETKAVNARELWSALGVKDKFADWIKAQIVRAKLVDGLDYCFASGGTEAKGRGGHNKIDYLLSINAAKELCMLSNCEKGKQIRQYFLCR